MKTCSACRADKPETDFSRQSKSRDGLQAYCKPCASERRKLYPHAPDKRTPEERLAYRTAYRAQNREKINANQRAAYARDPEAGRARQRTYVARDPEGVARRVRSWQLERKYGVTLDEWTKMFEAQGSACAACASKEPNGQGWHTDHCHRTNAIRGILCHKCNIALGHVNDSPEILLKLLQYLRVGV